MSSRLKETYQNEIVDALMKKFGYKNIMQVPKLEKVVINMGVGDAAIHSLSSSDTKYCQAAENPFMDTIVFIIHASIMEHKEISRFYRHHNDSAFGFTVTESNLYDI